MNTTINLKWSKSNKQVNGTSLQLELPNITNAMVKSKFGKLPTGLRDKYSQAIVIINNIETSIEGNGIFPTNNPSGIYTLYTLYGEWRIGGFSDNKFIKELAEYLAS